MSKSPAEGKRSAVSAKMITSILYYFRGTDPSPLQKYTYGEHRSSYPHTHADLEVFDESGRLIFEGREFHGGHLAFWKPLRTTMIPEWETASPAPA